MLKLHRLELNGFKSFVDPVSLDFAGGLTSIVGPNGCGKSNVADAVVWVLGERSAKSIRGSKMEDVIFAGSKLRKPVGFAEVQLTLSTDPGFEGADDGRMTIGRRLFRDGESQYLLNGKRVRLKQIKDLLMDTGLGIRAYSVIEQGKIGLILSGKPQERRKLLEEAAGVTRYKERRRVAEVKLEEARANLARLFDIISEVERTMRSLKRQAGAARRFQRRKEEHSDLLRRVLLLRSLHLFEETTRLRTAIDGGVARDAELTASLSRQEADLVEGRETLDILSRQLAERHGRDADLAATIEGKQEFLKGSRHRLDEIAERITAGGATSEMRNRQIAGLEESLSSIHHRHGLLFEEHQKASSEVTDDEHRILQIEALVGEAESRLESLRARLLSSMGDLNDLRNNLHRTQLEREKGSLRERHLRDEFERKEADLGEAYEASARATANLTELEKRLAERQHRRDALRAEFDRLTGERDEAAARREELEARLARLNKRAAVLDELGQAQEERRENLRAALAAVGHEAVDFLADRLTVPEGWEASVDLYLGELADAVVLPVGSDALELARTLAAGKGTGRLLAERPDATNLSPPDDPAIHQSLAEALALPQSVAAALPPAYLVDSRADAERLARRHSGVAFICRERLWAQAGILHVQGSEAQPGILARGHELAEVQRRIPPLDEQSARLAQTLEELEAEREDKRRVQEELDGDLAEVERELAVARARQEDTAAVLQRLEVEKTTVAGELADVQHELELIGQREEQFGGELDRSEELHGELESGFDLAQKEVESIRLEREAVRTTGASRRGRLDLVQERLDSHQGELQRIRDSVGENQRQLEQWSAESERLESRAVEIRTARESAEDELATALEARQASQELVLADQSKLDDQRAKLQEIEERLESLRSRRDEVRSEIGDVRVEEAAVNQDLEHLRQTFDEEFDEGLPESVERPDGVLAELEVDLERCKADLERLGPVNLLAAEEFAEHEERHQFLTTQRDDVEQSMNSLRKTIREIDSTSSERFLQTFVEVNQQFRQSFVQLFHGGEAEMRLLDEEDPLECGIEIVARPPGKRLQNLMLMSGGEKALTAIALLFALFKTKPSPFCILDEVDAPLDDVNTLRFVETLKTMSQDTQFIVVTHNKLTMEAASLLYGVTMQERGVSSLVSVELDDVQPEAVPVKAASA